MNMCSEKIGIDYGRPNATLMSTARSASLWAQWTSRRAHAPVSTRRQSVTYSLSSTPTRNKAIQTKYRLVLLSTAVALGSTIAAAGDARLVPRTEWVQLTPAVSPPPRSGMAMAYDVVSGKIVIFGGFGAKNFYFDDTWTFDGVTWTKLAPPVSPPARTAGAMTYDVAIQKLVLFGGFTKSAGYLGDTWLFDGAKGSWEETNPSLSPPPVTAPNMFTDPQNGRADVYGGYDGTFYQLDTWQFTGTTCANYIHPTRLQRAPAPLLLSITSRRTSCCLEV
jgi:hypothetical protein